MRWRGLWLMALGPLLAGVTAPTDLVLLQLKWHHQFQFAGYYAAQEQGYYREAGLEVIALEAEPGMDTVNEVVAGRAQYGVGNSSLLLSRQQGLPVVVLATVFQHSPAILMSPAGTGIASVHDLAGKRLMLEPHSDELVAYLRKEGVSAKTMTLMPHSFAPADLIGGKVDCISAYATDEPYFLAELKRPCLEFSPRMGGIDFYGDNLYTSEAELKNHPARVRAFREASMRGWKYAMQHPEEIADLIIARYGVRRGRAYLLYEAQRMAPLVQPSLVEMGYMYRGRWQHIVDTYGDLGLLPRTFRLEGFLYDPEAGVRQDYHRLAMALAAVLALVGVVGGGALLVLRLNFRLKAEIASREKVEETLRQEHENAERYLSVAEVILVAFDAEGLVTLLNRKGYSVLGCTEGSLVGQDLFRKCLIPEDYPRVSERFRQILAGACPPVTYNENQIIRMDGERRLIAWHNSLLHDRAGRIIGMLSSGEDITDRRRAERDKAALEAQLQQAQKMESLGSLAGGVAHDMNNVLGAILMIASGNVEDQPEGSATQRAFGTIVKAAERGGKMVKGLLSFAHMSPALEQELDLNAVLREEVQLLEHTTLARVHLELELAPDLHPIRGDGNALNHALMNLCVNALDAMPEYGTLTVRSRNLSDQWVEVQVADTGMGMPPEVLERALDPFFTTKPQGKGTGLGLSMVYSTVKAHHGEMDIQSAPGQGTRINLRFPACREPVVPPDPGQVPALEPARRALTVLVVDDDELVREALVSVLDSLGHRTLEAACGEDALHSLEAGSQPDLVIMDMNMPGLGGAATLPKLRRLRPGLPILLATGRTDQIAADLVSDHPGVILLPKPYTMRDLQAQLNPFGAASPA